MALFLNLQCNKPNESNSLKALYLGKKLHSLLLDKNSIKCLRFHSGFSKVINLESCQGLFSVVLPEVGRMGNYIVVPDTACDDFLSLGLRHGSVCEIIGKQLVLGNRLFIDLSKAQTWEGKLDKGFRWTKDELVRENLKALEAALIIYAAPNSASRKIYNLREHFLSTAAYEICNLETSERLSHAVKSLIGLGPGLTPMGDDFLTGFLSVIATWQEGSLAAESLKKSIEENLYRTNSISSAMLRNAIDNIYHEYIQELVYAVVFEEADKVFLCCRKLLKIGATSGSDLAAGIYLGFFSITQGKAR
jgi:hypothetical protein